MKDYRLGLYEKAIPNYLGWSDKIRVANECGFDFLEISIDETDEKLNRLEMTAEDKAALSQLMIRENFFFESMCLSGHRRFPLGSSDENIRVRGMDIMQKAILFARDIGIQIIQIAGYDVYYEIASEATKRYFAESLEKSVVMAAQYGIVLAFETMETDFMNTVQKAMYWVNQINSPYLGVYPDSGNITNAAIALNTSPLEDIRTGKGHIFAVHLKESQLGKFREIPYGAGHVDFCGIIRETYNAGVRRYLAEFWHTGRKEWIDDIKQANAFLRDCFTRSYIFDRHNTLRDNNASSNSYATDFRY